MKPGIDNATAYDLAFTHLNKKLYGGKLPIPMLILTRDRRITMGHFGPLRWADKQGKKTIQKIYEEELFVHVFSRWVPGDRQRVNHEAAFATVQAAIDYVVSLINEGWGESYEWTIVDDAGA